MDTAELYDAGDVEMSELGVDVPGWVEQDISAYDVAAILEGGCASGAYMPAVTYHTAAQTMAQHGDDVLGYIQDALGELPAPDDATSWSGIAVHYLSIAVEMWASAAADAAELPEAEAEESADASA